MSAAAHQVQRPAPLTLAEECTLSTGVTVRGCAARVLDLLRQTRDQRLVWPVGRHQAPAGWVPAHVLVEPWAGGGEGKRRLRGLREKGVRVQMERFVGAAGEQQTFLYRIGDEPKTAAPKIASSPPQRCALRYLLHRGIPSISWRVDLRVDLTPGRSPLAPGVGVSEESYLEALRHAYVDGAMSFLLGSSTAVLYCEHGAQPDPFPVMRRALTALGAVEVEELPSEWA